MGQPIQAVARQKPDWLGLLALQKDGKIFSSDFFQSPSVLGRDRRLRQDPRRNGRGGKANSPPSSHGPHPRRLRRPAPKYRVRALHAKRGLPQGARPNASQLSARYLSISSSANLPSTIGREVGGLVLATSTG